MKSTHMSCAEVAVISLHSQLVGAITNKYKTYASWLQFAGLQTEGAVLATSAGRLGDNEREQTISNTYIKCEEIMEVGLAISIHIIAFFSC